MNISKPCEPFWTDFKVFHLLTFTIVHLDLGAVTQPLWTNEKTKSQ